MYLLPVTLGDTPTENVLPVYNREVADGIRHFIVEDVRSARRFLKKQNRDADIDSLTFYTLDKHTRPEEVSDYLKPLEAGEPMGVISEAGCPAVADPGADVVAIAQRKGLKVVPLVGPSSILLALAASGLNGQAFAFAGYLPVKPPERAKTLRALERRARTAGESQIFIEAPYRNVKLLEQIVSVCDGATMLTVACDVTSPDEIILTESIAGWSRRRMPDIAKRPTIFIIGRALGI